MTRATVVPLFPQPGSPRPLEGLYLEHRLHELGTAGSTLVYGNFVSSLDGRIALIEPGGAQTGVLESLTSPNDFRLFQELHAQADCLITHGGYLRALARGELGNVLQVNAPDLVQWRAQNGLPAQPAIVIASASLDFPIHASIREHRQALHIATGRRADPVRVQAWRDLGVEVIFAGDDAMVEGGALIRELAPFGYKSLYLLTGPKMLETMLRARQLSRLYLTLRHQLLGGEHMHTLIEGAPLGTHGALALRTLYYDHGTDGIGQWFAQFEIPRQLSQPDAHEGA